MRLITDYMAREAPRRALDALTRKVFGFDFDRWVRAGYCRGDYVPYSFEEGGRIVANVSVNRMDFILDGTRRRFAQIGTVMTDPAYRGRGLARALMERALADWAGACEAMYLFANDGAVGFYEKLGFRPGREFQRVAPVWRANPAPRFAPVDPEDDARRAAYLRAAETARPNAAFAMDNFGLTAFWTAGMEHLYHCADTDCYATADAVGGTLRLRDVVCTRDVRVQDVIDGLPLAFSRVELFFTPPRAEWGLFETREYREDDCHCLRMGEGLACMEAMRLMFPAHSHA